MNARSVLRRKRLAVLAAVSLIVLSVRPAFAEEPPSAVGPLMNLLKSGRLPAERVGSVAELAARRGNQHDLAYLFGQVTKPDNWTDEARRATLDALAEAARNRKVKPAGDLSGLGGLLDSKEPVAIRRAAVQLAGLWKVEAAADQLKKLAVQPDAPQPLREAALTSLVGLGGEAARKAIDELTAEDQPQSVRYAGVAALARLDVQQAAARAAEVLAAGKAPSDPAPLVDAFLNRQGGTELLAAAIKKNPPPADVAKLALRHMFAAGRNDEILNDVLSEAAGISAEATKMTKAEVEAFVQDVLAHGDPERGEAIFRRSDLSCMKCHAVSKAGGDIGPDLSAVGQSSPVDYLVNSILDPNQAIKEAFLTRVVLTSAGEIRQGIVEDRDEDRMILKDATGKRWVVPTADIEFEKEGQSLMPQGLTKFLTRSELTDLVRFLSELGKPGPYAVRATPRMQRWRYLDPVPELLTEMVPDEETYRDEIVNADDVTWKPVYAKVGGDLPLAELPGGDDGVVFVRGEVEVSTGGAVGFRLDSAEGVAAWVDDRPVKVSQEFTAELERGRHTVTLRIDTAARSAEAVKLELFRPKGKGSPAEFEVVDGP